MKLTVKKSIIQKIISHIEGIISIREIRSVLSNILMEANDQNITVTASDTNITLSITHSANILSSGSVTLPAKIFSQIINNLRGDNIYLNVLDGNSIHIQMSPDDKNSLLTLMGSPASEYPILPPFKHDESNAFKITSFLEGLDRVSFAMAKEDARYIFNGVYINKNNNKTELVATDGRRLSYTCLPEDENIPLSDSFILPYKTVKELQKLNREDQGQAYIYYDNKEKSLHIKKDNITITSKTIDGNYPDYNDVIPQKVDYKIELVKDELIAALQQVSVMGAEPSKQIRIQFKKDELKLYATTPDLGEAYDCIKIDYKGDYLEMAFNSLYLLESLKTFKSENILFGFSSPSSPAIIHNPNDKSTLNVVMPMNIL